MGECHIYDILGKMSCTEDVFALILIIENSMKKKDRILVATGNGREESY